MSVLVHVFLGPEDDNNWSVDFTDRTFMLVIGDTTIHWTGVGRVSRATRMLRAAADLIESGEIESGEVEP